LKVIVFALPALCLALPRFAVTRYALPWHTRKWGANPLSPSFSIKVGFGKTTHDYFFPRDHTPAFVGRA
jgi:hypothetical protein